MKGYVPVAAFGLTGALLAAAQVAVDPPILLAERFVPGAGWAEVILLSFYAAWISRKFLDPRTSPRWRRITWLLFSVVFFIQFGLGLAGMDLFLMTGKLHLPVPALIVTGPLYRRSLSLMLLIYGVTLLVVGRAWCSHLCYLGAWDDLASRRVGEPRDLPAWRAYLQHALMLAVPAAGAILGWLAIPGSGTIAAISFGVVGVFIMILFSARTGQMVHCVTWCPIGALTALLGRISPFRMRIRETCIDCGTCRSACRYDALQRSHVRGGRPGWSCTLCGDCLRSCNEDAIVFRFPGLGPDQARALFVILVAAFHAVFLGVARI